MGRQGSEECVAMRMDRTDAMLVGALAFAGAALIGSGVILASSPEPEELTSDETDEAGDAGTLESEAVLGGEAAARSA